MRNLAIIFTSLLMLSLVIGTIGCDSGTEPTSTLVNPALHVSLDYVGVTYDHNPSGPGQIFLILLVDDGMQRKSMSIPLEGATPMSISDYGTVPINEPYKKVFDSGSLGSYFSMVIVAYHRIQQGPSYGSIINQLVYYFFRSGGCGADFDSLIDQINSLAPQYEYVGSYCARWNNSDSWGVGQYNAVGDDDLRLWFRIGSDSPQQPVPLHTLTPTPMLTPTPTRPPTPIPGLTLLSMPTSIPTPEPAPTAISTPVITPQPTLVPQWPTDQFDSSNTGLAPYPGVDNPNVRWSAFIPQGHIPGSPVIGAQGEVYVATTKGYLYALNPDGSTRWTFQPPIPVEDSSASYSSPAIGTDGTIYHAVGTSVSVAFAEIYAISPSGELIWSYRTDMPLCLIQSPVKLGPDGTVYVYAYGSSGPARWQGALYALDREGQLRWKKTLTTDTSSISDVGIGSEGIMYCNSERAIFALDPTNGSVLWSYDTVQWRSMSAIVVDDDGTVYVGLALRQLLALSPDGSLKWQFNSPVGTIGQIAIGDDGSIIALSYETLFALDKANGEEEWSMDLYGNGQDLIVDNDGTVYVTTMDWMPVIISIHQGNLRWNCGIEDITRISGLALSDSRTIYVACGDRLVALGEPD